MIFDVATGEPNDMNPQGMDTNKHGCTCLVVSPDDRLVCSGSSDGSVKVSDITAKFKFRMQHKSSVKEAVFSPDSKFLVTAGFRNILIWSAVTGTLVTTLTNHQNFINRMIFAANGRYLVTSGKDKRILVWDFANRATVAMFYAHCDVQDIHVTADLSAILFAPENVAYFGILKPNAMLKDIIDGVKMEIPDQFQQAQAMAFAFSGQKVIDQTSRSCRIL